MLMSTYSHSLDAKGRLIIPAKIREELGEGFVITKNPDHCLSVYPKAKWDELIAAMDGLPKISSEPARRLRRIYFGNSSTPEPDKQGRIIIPQDLRKYASLEKDVALVGVDDHVEIWDADTWNAYNESADLSDIEYNLGGINL
ncbi:MAG: division/cell wall cluster transcriptional repressor MraZ [Lachnospiraceae bacterium]|nr:division/cell wall cluster transcriptional repressor MraZ [Lachnospiraceae bacterium]MBR0086489.1 division/cell wall cluster transcriptional repressor MraZ [Lachnospiraceae bacterium]